MLTENRAEDDDESFSKGGMHGIIRRGSRALNSLVGSLMHGRPNDAREGAVSPLDEQVGNGGAKTVPQPPAQADDSMPERLNPLLASEVELVAHVADRDARIQERGLVWGRAALCAAPKSTDERAEICARVRV